ncbi:putative WD repeat-containing C2A9.03-like protein [Cladobotryum mycophilum]|uniref:WD repeat-containing C2A9.03-like protein n=1 Tax=Cladobotryum mycophilum TaxID=491253 RepID=A0ABR0S602_9HYPO
MRPAALPLPDRQNDDTDTQQKQDHGRSQSLYWDRQQEEQDAAAVHAPGNSNNTSTTTTTTTTTIVRYESVFSSGDEDEDDELDDDYNNAHQPYGNLAASTGMTHCPVDNDEDLEDMPDSYINDHAYLDRPPHQHLHYHYNNSRQQGEHDLDMSDSDGGAPLDSLTTTNDLILSDFDYDSGAQYHMEDSEEEEDSEEDIDEYNDATIMHMAPPMHPFGFGNNTLPPINGPLGTGTAMAAPTTQAYWPSMAPSGLMMAAPDTMIDPLPPVQLSNPNPSILGSENLGLVDFLRSWAYGQHLYPSTRLPRPDLHDVLRQAGDGIEQVKYSDLRGDNCDFQGLDWDSMDMTREAARERRRYTYKNYVNKPDSDKWSATMGEEAIPASDNFFRFKRMDIRRDVTLAHFQLRSVLACPTRTQAFYPSLQGVNVINTASRKTELAMNLREFPGMSSPAISTLDAACGVLMGGTFNGDYCLQALNSEDGKAYSEGQISTDISGITNHIRIYRPRRSHTPIAAIASNDHGFRVMDLQTEKFTSKIMYPFALNCSAISPDGRLRALVGDNLDVLITNADTGETLQKLSGHRDYGFACDWSDDGYTIATGFQDKGIKIWDARRWCNSSGVSAPLCTIRAEMAGVRSLRFSPVGSGKPVLVAAEEADYVNIIDATTFASKQTMDVFGEIGGVAFANDGQDLNVLCCDSHRGGLLQLERCGSRAEPFWETRTRRETPYSLSRGWDDEDEQPKRSRLPTYWDGPEPF